jgi:hypothetical protein
VTRPDFEVENPVTHARARFEIDKHAAPALMALADELAALRGKIDKVEAIVGSGSPIATAKALYSPTLKKYLAETETNTLTETLRNIDEALKKRDSK